MVRLLLHGSTTDLAANTRINDFEAAYLATARLPNHTLLVNFYGSRSAGILDWVPAVSRLALSHPPAL